MKRRSLIELLLPYCHLVLPEDWLAELRSCGGPTAHRPPAPRGSEMWRHALWPIGEQRRKRPLGGAGPARAMFGQRMIEDCDGSQRGGISGAIWPKLISPARPESAPKCPPPRPPLRVESPPQ